MKKKEVTVQVIAGVACKADRDKLRTLKQEAESSCTFRVRSLALADEHEDARQLLLEIGFHAGRASVIQELISEGEQS